MGSQEDGSAGSDSWKSSTSRRSKPVVDLLISLSRAAWGGAIRGPARAGKGADGVALAGRGARVAGNGSWGSDPAWDGKGARGARGSNNGSWGADHSWGTDGPWDVRSAGGAENISALAIDGERARPTIGRSRLAPLQVGPDDRLPASALSCLGANLIMAQDEESPEEPPRPRRERAASSGLVMERRAERELTEPRQAHHTRARTQGSRASAGTEVLRVHAGLGSPRAMKESEAQVLALSQRMAAWPGEQEVVDWTGGKGSRARAYEQADDVRGRPHTALASSTGAGGPGPMGSPPEPGTVSPPSGRSLSFTRAMERPPLTGSHEELFRSQTHQDMQWARPAEGPRIGGLPDHGLLLLAASEAEKPVGGSESSDNTVLVHETSKSSSLGSLMRQLQEQQQQQQWQQQRKQLRGSRGGEAKAPGSGLRAASTSRKPESLPAVLELEYPFSDSSSDAPNRHSNAMKHKSRANGDRRRQQQQQQGKPMSGARQGVARGSALGQRHLSLFPLGSRWSGWASDAPKQFRRGQPPERALTPKDPRPLVSDSEEEHSEEYEHGLGLGAAARQSLMALQPKPGQLSPASASGTPLLDSLCSLVSSSRSLSPYADVSPLAAIHVPQAAPLALSQPNLSAPALEDWDPAPGWEQSLKALRWEKKQSSDEVRGSRLVGDTTLVSPHPVAEATEEEGKAAALPGPSHSGKEEGEWESETEAEVAERSWLQSRPISPAKGAKSASPDKRQRQGEEPGPGPQRGRGQSPKKQQGSTVEIEPHMELSGADGPEWKKMHSVPKSGRGTAGQQLQRPSERAAGALRGQGNEGAGSGAAKGATARDNPMAVAESFVGKGPSLVQGADSMERDTTGDALECYVVAETLDQGMDSAVEWGRRVSSLQEDRESAREQELAQKGEKGLSSSKGKGHMGSALAAMPVPGGGSSQQEGEGGALVAGPGLGLGRVPEGGPTGKGAGAAAQVAALESDWSKPGVVARRALGISVTLQEPETELDRGGSVVILSGPFSPGPAAEAAFLYGAGTRAAAAEAAVGATAPSVGTGASAGAAPCPPATGGAAVSSRGVSGSAGGPLPSRLGSLPSSAGAEQSLSGPRQAKAKSNRGVVSLGELAVILENGGQEDMGQDKVGYEEEEVSVLGHGGPRTEAKEEGAQVEEMGQEVGGQEMEHKEKVGEDDKEPETGGTAGPSIRPAGQRNKSEAKEGSKPKPKVQTKSTPGQSKDRSAAAGQAVGEARKRVVTKAGTSPKVSGGRLKGRSVEDLSERGREVEELRAELETVRREREALELRLKEAEEGASDKGRQMEADLEEQKALVDSLTAHVALLMKENREVRRSTRLAESVSLEVGARVAAPVPEGATWRRRREEEEKVRRLEEMVLSLGHEVEALKTQRQRQGRGLQGQALEEMQHIEKQVDAVSGEVEGIKSKLGKLRQHVQEEVESRVKAEADLEDMEELMRFLVQHLSGLRREKADLEGMLKGQGAPPPSGEADGAQGGPDKTMA